MKRKLAAGNWKMHGSKATLPEIGALAGSDSPEVDVLICPPATLLIEACKLGTGIRIGGQDCHSKAHGPHTGDISAEMLADAGATYVIVGHSERRGDYGETDAVARGKVEAAWSAGLTAVLCIGETLEEREAGRTLNVVAEQLDGSTPEGAAADTLVIAYEPVWAIGTGKVPTLDQIAEVHDFMRSRLATRFGAETAEGIRLLYGGSVKPSNAAEIFAVSNVDGALVGGASLKAADFGAIVAALRDSTPAHQPA